MAFSEGRLFGRRLGLRLKLSADSGSVMFAAVGRVQAGTLAKRLAPSHSEMRTTLSSQAPTSTRPTVTPMRLLVVTPIRRVIAPVLLLAIVLSPLTAAAEEPANVSMREVALVDVSDDAKSNNEIFHEIYVGIKKHPTYNPKNIHAVLNAGGEVQQQNAVKSAQAILQSGYTAFRRGEFEDAAEGFIGAAGVFEQHFAFLLDASQYRGALLMLGTALLKDGEKKQADTAFERAAIVKADGGDATLGEDAKAVFEAAKARVRKLPLGGLQITSNPPNAEVYVDGRYKGVTPVTVAGLRKGKHFASVLKAGYVRQTMKIEIEGEELGEASVELKPARKKLLYDQLTTKLTADISSLKGERPKGGEGVRQVSKLLFSEVSVVVNITGRGDQKKVDLFIFDSATQLLLKRVTKTIDWSFRNKKAARALVKDLTDFDYANALGGDTTEVDTSEGGIETEWWFWTIIGVVVIGGVAVGTYFALSAEDPPPFAKDGNGSVVVTF